MQFIHNEKGEVGMRQGGVIQEAGENKSSMDGDESILGRLQLLFWKNNNKKAILSPDQNKETKSPSQF